MMRNRKNLDMGIDRSPLVSGIKITTVGTYVCLSVHFTSNKDYLDVFESLYFVMDGKSTSCKRYLTYLRSQMSLSIWKDLGGSLINLSDRMSKKRVHIIGTSGMVILDYLFTNQFVFVPLSVTFSLLESKIRYTSEAVKWNLLFYSMF